MVPNHREIIGISIRQRSQGASESETASKLAYNPNNAPAIFHFFLFDLAIFVLTQGSCCHCCNFLLLLFKLPCRSRQHKPWHGNSKPQARLR